MNNPINYWYQKYLQEKKKNEGMQEALRTEYEKGRADALANALTLDEIKGMENQAFLAGVEAERNKSILKNNDSNRKKI